MSRRLARRRTSSKFRNIPNNETQRKNCGYFVRVREKDDWCYHCQFWDTCNTERLGCQATIKDCRECSFYMFGCDKDRLECSGPKDHDCENCLFFKICIRADLLRKFSYLPHIVNRNLLNDFKNQFPPIKIFMCLMEHAVFTPTEADFATTKITDEQIAEETGCGLSQIYRHLQALEDKQYISRDTITIPESGNNVKRYRTITLTITKKWNRYQKIRQGKRRRLTTKAGRKWETKRRMG